MITHQLITLDNVTATNLTIGYDSGFDITIQNTSTAGYVYLGGDGVSSTNYGYMLYPGHAFSLELSGQDDLFAIASDTTTAVAVLMAHLEVGQ